MGLRLFNTMGRELQEFSPVKSDIVGFYGCGPTVYNYAHIGNMRAYVFQDTLKRSLAFLGYRVKHVMNVTDIGHLTDDADSGDDKMVKTAKERGESVLDIARFYTDAFFSDSERLNILRPDVVCKATEHVRQMIALIKRLEENGHTYQAGGNLYFDISTFPEYGKLARLNLDDLKAGARIDVDENKRNPYDFALWFTKSKFENQALVWDSPWGTGYPGWHIECSAMSMEYLGEEFDIHTGGIDHIPIHHTNEIAQSEGATGKRWVKYWLHNEFLVMDKGKMSKSGGNFLTLQTLVDKGFDPLDYRYFLLGGHYRSQITFSWDSMESAKNSRRNLVQRVVRILEALTPEELAEAAQAPERSNSKLPGSASTFAKDSAAAAWIDRFRSHIEEDLSTPRALSELQGLVRDQSIAPVDAIKAIRVMDGVLGLKLLAEAESARSSSERGLTADPDAPRVEALIAERAEAKKARNFARADEIRNQLKAEGIILADGPEGTTWRRSDGDRA
jgi:cysteinyl-tRNA synthetase